MNAFKSVQDAITGHYCCDIAMTNSQQLMDCKHCPYNDDSEDKHMYSCVSHLNNDIQYYLNQEQKHQEAEQQKVQPPLPGIFDDPVEKIGEKLKEIVEETEEKPKQEFSKKKWDKK